VEACIRLRPLALKPLISVVRSAVLNHWVSESFDDWAPASRLRRIGSFFNDTVGGIIAGAPFNMYSRLLERKVSLWGFLKV